MRISDWSSDVCSSDLPLLRQRLAALHCEAEVLRLNRLRTLSARLRGQTPGPEASIQKAMADEHGQHVMELAKDLAGTAGVLEGSGPAGPVPEDARTGAHEGSADAQFPDVHPIWHYRSEEPRVGNTGARTCKYRWA